LTGYVQEKMKHIKTLGNVERKFLNTLTQQETMMVDDKAEVITKSALYYENIKIERIANFILPLLLVTKNKNPFLGLSHDTFNLIMEWIIVKPYSHTKPAQVFQALMQSSQKKIAPTPPFHIEQRIGFFQCLIDQKEENSRKRKELSF
jgi:hypothetical protein